jgi:hypothetical protein
VNLIDEHRDEIEELCRRCRVRRLDAFGSAVRDDYDPETSDSDLLVELYREPGRNSFHDYLDLKQMS